MRRVLFIAALLLVGAAAVRAQFAPAVAPVAPVMYVRFGGPPGTKITVYRGFDDGQTLELPCTVGFRPGYGYRIAVFDVPGFPRQVFCPSLNVLGALAFSPKMKHADFPAQINFTIDEFRRIASGAFVKKVITLERPDIAYPIATRPDEPLQISVPPSRDPYVEAAEHGQPIIVFEMGQRYLSPRELSSLGIAGTVLLPGERVLGTPRVPPYLAWRMCPVWDPVSGPWPPSEFMTLYDGGDSGWPAGFDRFGRLKGVDPTDTVAAYTDIYGNQRLAVSNRVGLCVPRFVIFEGEYFAAVERSRINLEANVGRQNPTAATGQLALKQELQREHPEAVKTRLRMSSLYNQSSTVVVGRVQGLEIKSNLRNTESVESAMGCPKVLEPEGPLVIIKWPDKECASVGDIVTFYLKYRNTGGQPITGVVVTDSLTPRLEYVAGSAKTDRDALFTIQPNTAGSAVLRWEFTSPLPAREHGLISFQVRIR